MALAVNDVIQVSFYGTLFAQRIITNLHYIVSVATAGSTEDHLKLICDDIAGGLGSVSGLLTHMLDCQGVQYNSDSIRAQRIYPTRTIYMEATTNDPGQHADPCTAPNIAVSFLKRTATAGRKGVGRVQLAGIPQTGYVDGKIDATYQTTILNVWAADLLSSYSTAGPAITLVPGLYNPTGAGTHFSPLLQVLVEDTVRTMHRRTVRVGI